MLNVDTIKNGLVIDHIKAGYGPKIFSWLGLDKADFCVALIMNAPSKTQGKKDIIKIDADVTIDMDILGYVDPNVTIDIIKNEKYKIITEDDEIIAGVCDYGIDVVASLSQNNLFSTQFHPEKSGTVGLRILNRFCNL